MIINEGRAKRGIHKKYVTDRRADAAFQEAGISLIRVTDKQVLAGKALSVIEFALSGHYAIPAEQQAT